MLNRLDPFREMATMRRAMDRLIDNSLTDHDDWSQVEWALPLDVIEHEDEYVVRASVPGVKPDDLDVTFNKGMLTIRGEVKQENEKEEGQYHLRERRLGIFTRTISLPSTIQSEQIAADCQNGILTLRLPKAEEVKPRRISIQSGQSGQKIIDHKR